MFGKGDFHLHSTASDGSLTPREVIQFAKERQVDIVAITDHNTTLGVDSAIEAGKEYGVKVIPGIELSTRYKGSQVHVLGYFIGEKYKDKTFQRALALIKARKVKAVKELLKNVVEINIDNNKLSVLSGIRLLKTYGAIVVLAHPISLDRSYLGEIINLPFDGIEAKYCRNTTNETKFFLKLAKYKKLIYTAGSDFHTNKYKDVKHGLIGDVYLDAEEIVSFLAVLNIN